MKLEEHGKNAYGIGARDLDINSISVTQTFSCIHHFNFCLATFTYITMQQ